MRRGEVLRGALLVAAIALAGWLSVRWQVQFDWSRGDRASLTGATAATLAALDGPVEIVSYARERGGQREPIARFVARYTALKPDLTLRFVDPDRDPDAARAKGVRVDGELELAYRGRTQRLLRLNERELTSALARLARGGERVVAFVVGHGERRPDGDANHDLGRFGALLAEQGLRTVNLALATAGQVPDGTALVVLAGPRTELAAAELDALVAWVDGGGALLWLTDPNAPDGLARLGNALGVGVLPGTVVDATAQALGIGDPSFVAIDAYPPHATTDAFDLVTLLPQAAALAKLAGDRFALTPLLRTGARSWTESGPIDGTIGYDANGAEVPGPVDVAVALTRLSPRPDATEQRVVVVGDGDFLSNSFLGNGGNRELGLRLVNWLLGDDRLVDIDAPAAPDRHLALGPGLAALLGVGFLVVLPLGLLLTGLGVAWLRRRR
jgi:hypothetical protein